ncbi:Zinc finger CCCH domain-containing protein 56 [Tripterygium wilfordii]|uniref:Zinc finger CCCH domain-containing protein 56 n=1 Tax=Tripterygium wilfordii TaxID=458696 RepID=A0A7J7CJR7_TRIWF|nr:Zinc finger CCCH domain-containing protein 56 [Tripterygium wilfordii]
MICFLFYEVVGKDTARCCCCYRCLTRFNFGVRVRENLSIPFWATNFLRVKMEYSGNVVHVIPNASENWMPNSGDPAVWATEDEYRVWNTRESSTDTTSNSHYDQRQSQTRSGSEPPNKKSRNAGQESKSKAIGKMFFKTKLCCKFRAGTCPYITNCNFAHSMEELRRPPPNWQEIVAAHEDEKGVQLEPREEFQIPSYGVETQRSYKGRHCKKFYTEEGCPYGDNCTFLHDEQSKYRESVAISLGPGGYGGGGGGGGGSGGSGGGSSTGGGGGGGGGGGAGAGVDSAANVKPSNWKTRICNKWELTGYCPFGSKCHFAHGAAELHRYGGGLVEAEANSSAVPTDSKQTGVPSKNPADSMVGSVPSLPHSDVYHIGVSSQRSCIIIQKPGQRTHQKWKGPDRISRIYGDWIDDIE